MKANLCKNISLALCLLLPIPASAQWWEGEHAPSKPIVSVSGEAVVYVSPDKCLVTLGIERKGDDVVVIQGSVNESARALVSAIKKFGVVDKDIQTDMVTLTHYGDYQPEGKHIARQSLTVTLREPGKAEGFLIHALKSGATSILGVDFQTSELRKFRDQARQMAVQAAKEKAELFSKELGVTGLKPFSLKEVKTWEESWYGWWWGRRGGGTMQNVSFDARSSGGSSDTGIPPGQIAVRATVAATFTHSGS